MKCPKCGYPMDVDEKECWFCAWLKGLNEK